MLQNCALNKPITCNQKHYDKYKIEFANDGNIDNEFSFWSNSFDKTEIIIDLEKKYKIQQLKLKQFKDIQGICRCKNFELYYSDDNSKFIKVLEDVLPNNNSKLYSFNIKECTAQYWKFVILDNYKRWSNGICEIQLLKEESQYLLKYDNKYYTIKDNKITDINNFENTSTYFKENGFDDYTLITKDLLKTTFEDLNNVKLLMWVDEKNIQPTIEFELEKPFRPIDKFKGKIEIIKQVEK